MKPLCFVIMPFGKKKYRVAGKEDEWVMIDFDDVYDNIIKPGILGAEMEPIRADEEQTRGSIHKPMFERIILSDYVVADLTGANANVFYELGIRHAVKPFTTVSIFEKSSELPFDLIPFRTYPYEYSKEEGLKEIDSIKHLITRDLVNSTNSKSTDSPVYQLVDGIKFQNSVAHEKTDIFRNKVKYDNELRDALETARQTDGDKNAKIAALNQVITEKLFPLGNQEAGILVDAMLSYRDVSAWKEMQSFIESMPLHLQQTVMVQEQYGFALNRNSYKEKAIKVLENVIAANGPSSETYGILGRVYKDRYDLSEEEGNTIKAAGFLDKAIEVYQKGFQADWRDAYPGVNLLTLLAIKGEEEKIKQLAPVVTYSVERKLETKTPDYWDYATLLEIAVITNDEAKANESLKKALATPIKGSWMLESTMNSLKRLSRKRKSRNEDTSLSDVFCSLVEEEFKNMRQYDNKSS